MAKVSPFYSVNEADKPADERVYHDQSGCGPGSEIKPGDRRSGTGGYRRCQDCKKLD